MKSQQPVLSMVLIPNGDNPLEVEKIDFSGLQHRGPSSNKQGSLFYFD